MSGGDAVAVDDCHAVLSALDSATHILSSVPPLSEGGDPVLLQYGDAIAANIISILLHNLILARGRGKKNKNRHRACLT